MRMNKSDRHGGMSRRDVLRALGGLGFGSSLVGTTFAQASAPDRRVDVHHHFFVSPAARKYFASSPTPEPIVQYSPARSLDALEAAGVQKAFLSCPIPFGDDRIKDQRDAAKVARDLNDYGAKLVADNKGRFGLFALLPLPDIDASLREIEHVFDTLKADGVALVTSYGNRWLGDAAFEPVFDELNRRKAVVYTHPVDAPCCHNLVPNGTLTIEWLTDTSRAIWSLINDGNTPGSSRTFASRATRYANVQFIWSHAGGTLVGLASRFLGQEIAGLSADPAKDSKLYHLRRFFYDTATAANPIQMQALKRLVGSSQILFGTDFPFVPVAVGLSGLQTAGFSPQELRAVCFDNALRILPGIGRI